MTTNFYEYDISEEIEKISSVVVYANERKKRSRKKLKCGTKVMKMVHLIYFIQD